MRILLSFFFLFLLFFVFSDNKKEKVEKFSPISGTIYPTGSGSGNPPSPAEDRKSPVTDVALTESEAPSETRKVSDGRNRIVQRKKSSPAKPQESQTAKTMVINPPATVHAAENKPVTPKMDAPAPTAPSIPPPAAETVTKKENEQIIFSFHFLNQAVKNSNSSYFFSDRHVTIKDVTVSVVSITPYRDQDILKFQVSNGQQQYFFISVVSLSEDRKPVQAQFFYEPLVSPEKTQDCIALIPRMNRTQLTLMVTESGGKSRTFTLKFVTI